MKKDKKKIARVIATWVVTGVMLSIFILDTVVLALDNKYTSAITITNEDFSDKYGDDKIHFLNTANSDCILLESNGKFLKGFPQKPVSSPAKCVKVDDIDGDGKITMQDAFGIMRMAVKGE